MATARKPKDTEEPDVDETEDEDETPDYQGMLKGIVSEAVTEAMAAFQKNNGPAPRRTDPKQPSFFESLFGTLR